MLICMKMLSYRSSYHYLGNLDATSLDGEEVLAREEHLEEQLLAVAVAAVCMHILMLLFLFVPSILQNLVSLLEVHSSMDHL